MERLILFSDLISRPVLWESPLDVSLCMYGNEPTITAWHIPAPCITPVVIGHWTGDVNQGASVNFRNIYFNPHAHGTHTECVGHISKEFYSIHKCLRRFMFSCRLLTLQPENNFITKQMIMDAMGNEIPEAVMVRTLPNDMSKLTRQYSAINWPCFEASAMEWLRKRGVLHILTDTPSVDPREDGGALLAHKAFWNYPSNNIRTASTITELIFVREEIPDGLYILNLQIASFHNDATPSKPVLYALNG